MISYTSLNMLFSKKFFSCRPESGRLIGRFALWNKHVCFASCFVGVFFTGTCTKIIGICTSTLIYAKF